MKRQNRPYTEEDVELLIQLRNGGKTEREIATALGRPYNSIHCKVKELRKLGKLPLIRNLAMLSDDDIAEMAVEQGLLVDDVTRIIAKVGKPYVSSRDQFSTAIQSWTRQKGRCVYFGVPIYIDNPPTPSTQAFLLPGEDGGVVWVSSIARKMRGKLSHEMFMKALTAIFNNLFTARG